MHSIKDTVFRRVLSSMVALLLSAVQSSKQYLQRKLINRIGVLNLSHIPIKKLSLINPMILPHNLLLCASVFNAAMYISSYKLRTMAGLEFILESIKISWYCPLIALLLWIIRYMQDV
ncbi:uncharacterized protein EV154DRAFT_501387, partial [Mucor mucedo]|uniref:uncharacterized protein n=1 Tax=Mucor mucedo TaxID=29922 RepID=UPI00221E6A69